MPALKLRDYQEAAVQKASERNTLVVLPTNAGKTIISAKVIEDVLHNENSRELGRAKKIIFLAPGRALAQQQARVLLEQIGPLQEEETHLPSGANGSEWRLGLVIGMSEVTLR